MTLEPAGLDSSWNENDTSAPSLEYNFTSKAGDAEAFVDFLPTFRIYPGMKLRVAVSVDNHPATLVEVPGSSGAENENGAIRSNGVQNNYTRARIPLAGLSAGSHTLKIRAVDPGAVIDCVSFWVVPHHCRYLRTYAVAFSLRPWTSPMRTVLAF